MHTLSLPSTTDKHQIFSAVAQYLDSLGIAVASTDFDRPWGGFFVIDTAATEAFIAEFFPSYSYDQIANGLALTPKILIPAPGARLSWQYHYRRAEIWSAVAGPVGYCTSSTDEQSPVQTLNDGQVVEFGAETRHRLIGLDGFGVVAEFWKHTDPNHPSDEDDIVRVQDDFSRA